MTEARLREIEKDILFDDSGSKCENCLELISEIRRLQSEREWVKCTERLPEAKGATSDNVLTVDDVGWYELAHVNYTTDTRHWFIDSGEQVYPDYWMNLPTEPKSDEPTN